MKERLAGAEQTPNGVPPFPGGPKGAALPDEGVPPFALVLMARAGAPSLVRHGLKDHKARVLGHFWRVRVNLLQQA